MRLLVTLAIVILVGLPGTSLYAETGEAGWLRYARVSPEAAKRYESLPGSLAVLGNSVLMESAKQELISGVEKILAKKLAIVQVLPAATVIVLGTADSIRPKIPELKIPALHGDSYWLATQNVGDQNRIIIAGQNDRGALYGAFALLLVLP